MFKKTSNWFWEQKPQCWFWSIEEPEQDYLTEQLKYHNKLIWRHNNLKNSKNKIYFNSEDKPILDYCETMFCDIKADDLIVIKNTPDFEHFILVKVIGEHDFKSENDDFGYFLPIEILGEFYKYSSIVPASLLRALHQEHNLIDTANSNQRHIISTLSSQILNAHQPSNVIVELWQRAEEYLGRMGAIIIFLFTIIEIMSAIEGTVVDYAEFKAIIERWYWALR
ncbi:hypothetical protein QUF74_16465 [Candidatus Halobeggiatoa sp. HSG11]|nr:hypothetical protein [Candidatus Halobeggiatoa sp. HSG11]